MFNCLLFSWIYFNLILSLLFFLQSKKFFVDSFFFFGECLERYHLELLFILIIKLSSIIRCNLDKHTIVYDLTYANWSIFGQEKKWKSREKLNKPKIKFNAVLRDNSRLMRICTFWTFQIFLRLLMHLWQQTYTNCDAGT